MNLVLVRHGETDGNKTLTFQTPDTPLNENGLKQAKILGSFFKQRYENKQVPLILSSDYNRAFVTASSIAENIGTKVKIEELLQERDFGNWRGRKYKDILQKHGTILGYKVEPPEGESLKVFEDRCFVLCSKIKQILSSELMNKQPRDIILVSHGLTVKELLNIISKEAVHHDQNKPLPSFEHDKGYHISNSSFSIIPVSLDETNNISFNLEEDQLNQTPHLHKATDATLISAKEFKVHL
eukprot:snap_masked-scaffold_14-processed-gene-1.11-mRNA-1 protein AED:1.00 eAED:1.00 QI:0/-1/0/0/-1/1/1/0/239